MTWHRFASVAMPVILLLVLGSCAEMVDSPTDIARLRGDLQSQAQTLAQVSARLDTLEQRQSKSENAGQHMQQELSQAIQVLLKRVLIMENLEATRETIERSPRDLEASEIPARQPSAETPKTSTPRVDSPPVRHLSLGMTQEDVRRLLGEPVSIETAGSYIFWQYSQMNNQKYVIFEKASGQVSGWRGL